MDVWKFSDVERDKIDQKCDSNGDRDQKKVRPLGGNELSCEEVMGSIDDESHQGGAGEDG